MRCPRCKLENPSTALRCDCGYDFATDTVQQSFVDAPRVGEPVTQVQVRMLLRSGVLFSVLWLAGIGSLIALWRGLEAKRLIERADRPLEGMGAAWWCIIVGSLGILVWLPMWLLGAAAHAP
jgi:hypothetical protein